MDFSLFSALSNTPAPSGREELLRDFITQTVKPLAATVTIDNLGNLIVFKKGKGKKKLMLAAHMDEVALRVRYIDDKGFLRFTATGGIDPRTLVSQRVSVVTADGKIVNGVIGSKPAHYLTAADLAKPPTIDALFIDTGHTKADTPVEIGDPVVLDRQPVELANGLFSAKAIDDRAGVYILIETIKNIKEHDADIYFVFTTQEEFGLVGAQVATRGICPDIALAVDTTGALDIPSMSPQDYVLEAGKGIGITLVDNGTIAHNGVVRHLRQICKEEKIPYQLRVSAKGSNDAKVMQRSTSGVPVCPISLPVRYIHSNVEVAAKQDVDAACALVLNFAMQCAREYKI